MEKKDKLILFWTALIFIIFYLVPENSVWWTSGILGGFKLLGEYAKKHVLTCLVPAFFIAGAITVFIKKDKVMKYLGHETKNWVSYSIAAVSGSILAVCSCTVLPLFAGIRKRGAGLGPAITFLFSGPAINVAAMFLTISVLGLKIGMARIILAILLSVLVGLNMQLIFKEKSEQKRFFIQERKEAKTSHHTLALFFTFLIGILVVNGLQINTTLKYSIMGFFTVGTILLVLWRFEKPLTKEWLSETWEFTKQLLPLLFIGVFIAGFLMVILPESWIINLVGKNTIVANLIASVFGAFMYFSTLTEIPILQALLSKGMNSGPALALLLAGPSLSLPNMLVVRSVLGTKKTIVYVILIIFYATVAGFLFGLL